MSTVPTTTFATTSTDIDGRSERVQHRAWDVPLGRIEAERVDDDPWSIWIDADTWHDFTPHQAAAFAHAMYEAAMFTIEANLAASTVLSRA